MMDSTYSDGTIINLSDQLTGYAEEVADAVQHISERYEYSAEFSLLIVQTAIEDMKVDCQHHAVHEGLKKIAENILYSSGD